MDPWQMFCELCRAVVENDNVYLDVLVTKTGIEMMLMPIDCYDDFEDEEGDE